MPDYTVNNQPHILPHNPHPPKGKTITTNKVTPGPFPNSATLLHTIPNPQPKTPEPKSNLVILAVTALIVGWLIVFAGIFTISIPFFVCGFSTILASNVLAVLSLRE
jgi:hypothetical protein